MRIPRRWVVYQNDHEDPLDHRRHLICEHCRQETECGLLIGDYRQWALTDVQRWYTRRTTRWSIPACEKCESAREWKKRYGRYRKPKYVKRSEAKTQQV